MLSINPAPTDTAVPLSHPTPSECQQAPASYVAILHHQPMRSSKCNMFPFIQRPATRCRQTGIQTEWESQGWEHVVPVVSQSSGSQSICFSCCFEFTSSRMQQTDLLVKRRTGDPECIRQLLGAVTHTLTTSSFDFCHSNRSMSNLTISAVFCQVHCPSGL